MNKFIVYDWAYSCGKELAILNVKTNSVIDGNIFEWAEKFFNLGVNVMIYRSKDKNEMPVLYIDDRRFSQR